eukprot:2443867-Rhodomonas_salina.3
MVDFAMVAMRAGWYWPRLCCDMRTYALPVLMSRMMAASPVLCYASAMRYLPISLGNVQS